MKGVLSILLLAALVIAGCRGEPAYDRHVRESCRLLKARQTQLTEDFKLGEWERYDWSQDSQELVFSHQGEAEVIAEIQFVGSYSRMSHTWRWAWANPTVLPGMKVASAQVKRLGVEKGWPRLTDPQWTATEQDGWDMTGVALRVLDAKGAYRSPGDDGLTFVVITGLRWTGEHEGDAQEPHEADAAKAA